MTGSRTKFHDLVGIPEQSEDAYAAFNHNFAIFSLVANAVMADIIEAFLQHYPQLSRMSAAERHRTVAHFMHNHFEEILEKIKHEQKELFIL